MSVHQHLDPDEQLDQLQAELDAVEQEQKTAVDPQRAVELDRRWHTTVAKAIGLEGAQS